MDRVRTVGAASAILAGLVWYVGLSSYPDCETLAATSGSVRLTTCLRIDYAAGECTWYANADEVHILFLGLFTAAVLVSMLAFGYSLYRHRVGG